METPAHSIKAERVVDLTRIVPVLGAAGGALLILGAALNLYVEARAIRATTSFLVVTASLLDPNAEASLSAWISTLVLAAVAVGLCMIGQLARGSGPYPWRYAVLASVALLLSIDEAAALHERWGVVVSRFDFSLVELWGWLVVGVPFAVVVGLVVLWVARGIDRVLRRRLTVAGSVFLVGAVGVSCRGGRC